MSTDGNTNNTKAPWWMDAIKTLGLPTAFLCVVMYMVWEAGTWAGKEVVVPLFNKQVEFIDQAMKMTNEMTVTTQAINKTLEAHGQHAIENLKLCTDIHNKISTTEAQTKINGERIQSFNDTVLKTLEEIADNTKPIVKLATPPVGNTNE